MKCRYTRNRYSIREMQGVYPRKILATDEDSSGKRFIQMDA